MALLTKYAVFTSNGTWTVPSDWNNSNNRFQCIGAGGNGSAVADGSGSGGGGGGAYAAVANVTLTPGTTVYVRIGAGGGGATGADTWVNWVANSAPTATANGCLADGGLNGSGITAGTGGTVANSIGTTEFAGGNGGNGNDTGDTGGGGGGAAGPGGAGKAGGTGGTGASDGGGGGGGAGGGTSTAGSGTTTGTGGAGGNGPAGTGSGAGATGTGTGTAGTAGTGGGGGGGGGTAGTGGNGGSGSDTATVSGTSYGAGGGGGGCGDNNASAGVTPGGGNGGLYGGGGGGRETSGTGGLGANGIAIIRYTVEVNSLYWRNGSATWNTTSQNSWSLTSGGAASEIIPDSVCDVFFDANSDTGSAFTVTIGSGAVCRNLTASGLDNQLTFASSLDFDPLEVYGNYSTPSSNFRNFFAAPTNFRSTSTGRTISTSNTFGSITFNGVGGSWTFLSNVATSSNTEIATLANGTINLNNYTLNTGIFSSNTGNTRSIVFGETGKIVLKDDSPGVVWDANNTTNFSTSGNRRVELIYNGGGVSPFTLNVGNLGSNALDYFVTSGTYQLEFSPGGTIRSLDLTGFSGTWLNRTLNLRGNLTLSTGATIGVGSNTITFSSIARDQYIDTVGKILDVPITINYGSLNALPRITASDAENNDNFGWSVDVDNDIAIVGAYLEDGAGTDRGAAYIFTRSGSDGFWTEQQKLTASDTGNSDQFGFAVAVSGNTAVVTAPTEDGAGTDRGAAYVFTRSGSTWTEQQKLTASDAANNDYFGGWSSSPASRTVDIDGDTIVVGAPFEDTVGGDSGAVYVYTRSGNTWTEQQKLTANDAASGDNFGISVGISGDDLVVGAYADDHSSKTNAGSAYIFKRSGGTWTVQQKLIEDDLESSSQFGYSVGISGETIVIGARFEDTGATTSRGAAYVYARANNVWSLQQKLTASDAVDNDEFGTFVSIDKDALIVTAPSVTTGNAYIFTRSGNTWTQKQKFTPPSDGFGFFASQAVVSNNRIIIGNRGTSVQTGAAFAYYIPTVYLSSNLSSNLKVFSVTAGAFNANNYNLTVGDFDASLGAAETVKMVTMGSGTWELTGAGEIWNVAQTTIVYSNTSNIYLSNTSTTQRKFVSNYQSYYKLTIGGTTGNTNTYISGSNNSFYEIGSNKTVAHQIYFDTGSTTSMNLFTVNGSSGNLVTLGSIAPSPITSNLVLHLDAANTSSYTGANGAVVNSNLWFDISGQTINANTNHIFRNPGSSITAYTAGSPKYIALRHKDLGNPTEVGSDSNDFIELLVTGNTSPMQIMRFPAGNANTWSTSSRTIELWIRLVEIPGSANTTDNVTATTNGTVIIGCSRGTDFALLATQDGTSNTQYKISPRWDDSNSGITSQSSNSSLNLNEWNHIVCVLEPPAAGSNTGVGGASDTIDYRASLYINGVFDKTVVSDDPDGITDTDAAWRIGSSQRGRLGDVGKYYNLYTWMDVSLVRFYRNALTNSQILQNYNSSKAPFTPPQHILEKLGSNTVSVNYLNIANSSALPNTLTWYAGANSVDSGNNAGWIFTAAPSAGTGNFLLLF